MLIFFIEESFLLAKISMQNPGKVFSPVIEVTGDDHRGLGMDFACDSPGQAVNLGHSVVFKEPEVNTEKMKGVRFVRKRDDGVEKASSFDFSQ